MDEPTFRIRDPIHGFIKLNEFEKAIIDTSLFRRLRYIRQLGMTYYVYPTAEHSRFSHSLGTMAVADKLILTLKNKGEFGGFNWNEREDFPRYRQMLRIATLIHDLGHSPFSHTLDRRIDTEKGHEEITREIILNSELKDKISAFDGISAEDIVRTFYYPETPEERFFMSIVKSELDTDRMDYLLRDSYFCGVDYGKYDLTRLLDTICVIKHEDDEGVSFSLGIEYGGIQVLEAFIIGRYSMFIQVMFHRTRRIYDILLQKYVDKKQGEGALGKSLVEYKDNDILAMIEEERDSEPLARALYYRVHPHWISETKVHPKPGEVQKFYQEIIPKLKSEIGNDKILTDEEATESPHKLVPFSKENLIYVKTRYSYKSEEITRVSSLIEKMNEDINILRVYADVSAEEAERLRNELGVIVS